MTNYRALGSTCDHIEPIRLYNAFNFLHGGESDFVKMFSIKTKYLEIIWMLWEIKQFKYDEKVKEMIYFEDCYYKNFNSKRQS